MGTAGGVLEPQHCFARVSVNLNACVRVLSAAVPWKGARRFGPPCTREATTLPCCCLLGPAMPTGIQQLPGGVLESIFGLLDPTER